MTPSGALYGRAVTRWRRIRETGITSIVAMVVLASCSTSKSTGVTGTTVAHKVANPSAVPVDLRSTIFDQLPSNYIEEPVGTDLDGPLGLDATAEAVDDQETAEQEMVLQQYGFRRAYQRTWIVKGTGETLIIRVQVMGSPKKALGYFNLLTFASRTSTQQTAFATPDLTDASGFTRPFSESAGNQVSQDINLARGRLFYHLIFTGPQGSLSPSYVLSLADSQSTEAASLGYR
jgi:hypothetical protein